MRAKLAGLAGDEVCSAPPGPCPRLCLVLPHTLWGSSIPSSGDIWPGNVSSSQSEKGAKQTPLGDQRSKLHPSPTLHGSSIMTEGRATG